MPRCVPALTLALLTLGLVGACGTARTSSDRLAKELADSRSAEAAAFERASQLVREAQRAEISAKDDIAIAKYRESLELFRNMPAAWNNLGSLLMKRGDNLQAADAFKTASELSPTDARPLYNLGALWEQRGYLEDASKWYDQALARDENFLPALRRRVLVDQMLDRTDDKSLLYTRKALLLEKDPWWIDRFKRAEVRFRESENARTSESGSI